MKERKIEPPEQAEDGERQVSTPRLQTLADAAAAMAQAKQWQARKNGMQNAGPPSEVRSLNDDAEAKAQAEAAMTRMMAKLSKKPRHR
jgi:hypothetical protein